MLEVHKAAAAGVVIRFCIKKFEKVLAIKEYVTVF